MLHRPSQSRPSHRARGLTLIELMIVMAILAILASIAIPAYHGYIEEAKFAKLRSSIDGMRVFIEDYRLENGVYVPARWQTDRSVTTLESLYDWLPDGDGGGIDYTLTVNADGSSYNIFAVDTNDATAWVRCEDRMNNCCYADTPGASVDACP